LTIRSRRYCSHGDRIVLPSQSGKGHVWTALAAQEDSGADAARSGADMCPACSARHPRPLAL